MIWNSWVEEHVDHNGPFPNDGARKVESLDSIWNTYLSSSWKEALIRVHKFFFFGIWPRYEKLHFESFIIIYRRSYKPQLVPYFSMLFALTHYMVFSRRDEKTEISNTV